MEKSVIISVKGNQNTDEDAGKLELITEGRYYRQDNAYFVTYRESEVTGMEGTVTTLKIADGIVTLVRTGSVNSQFIFERGQKHVSYYDTSYGAFIVGVLATDVNIKVDDKGGEIRVGYQLEIDNNSSGTNDFHMFIREAGYPDGACSKPFIAGN